MKGKRLALIILHILTVSFGVSGCKARDSGSVAKASGTFELHFKQFEEEIFYKDLWQKCQEKDGRPLTQADFDRFDSEDIMSDISSEKGYWIFNDEEPRSAIVSGDLTIAEPSDKFYYVCIITGESVDTGVGSREPTPVDLRCDSVITTPSHYSVATGTGSNRKYLDLVLKTKSLAICNEGLETRQKNLMCMPYDTANGVHWQLFNIETRKRIGWAFGVREKNQCLVSIEKSSRYICAPSKQIAGGYAIYDLATDDEPRRRRQSPQFFAHYQECIQEINQTSSD